MSETPKEETKQHGLTLVKDADERLRPIVDPQLKAVLDDLKRRYRVMRERERDAPDAA